MNISEGALCFVFDEAFIPEPVKYDEWTFYRKHFQKTGDGVKAVDILALNSNCLWLIEVKDYRGLHQANKHTELVDDLCKKVIDTLSGLLAAKFNANAPGEKNFAQRAIAAKSLRVVFHLEQAENSSKLFRQRFDPASLSLEIRKRLKAIDPRALIVNLKMSSELPWQVQSVQKT